VIAQVSLVDDIAMLHGMGIRLVLVLGAQPQIDRYILTHSGRPPTYASGCGYCALQAAIQGVLWFSAFKMTLSSHSFRGAVHSKRGALAPARCSFSAKPHMPPFPTPGTSTTWPWHSFITSFSCQCQATSQGPLPSSVL
jgi:hypothetical protein